MNIKYDFVSGSSDEKKKKNEEDQKTKKDEADMMAKKAEMNEKLDEIQKEFDDETLASVKKLDLERMNYEAPDEDELMSLAKKSVGEKYAGKREESLIDAEKKKRTLAEAIEELTKNAETQKNSAQKDYEKAIADTENSALKRGVARSSMAQGAVNELIRALADKKTEIEGEKIASAEKFGDKIAETDVELKKALEKIDEEEDSAVKTAFDKLKKESEEKKNEVLKYNNTLEEKEKNFEAKTYDVKTEKELAEIKNRYDYKKLAVALDYYLSIDDKVKALKEFSEDERMKDVLGDYYSYMYNVMMNRAR